MWRTSRRTPREKAAETPYIYICGGYLGAHLIFKDELARRQANNLQTYRKPTKTTTGDLQEFHYCFVCFSLIFVVFYLLYVFLGFRDLLFSCCRRTPGAHPKVPPKGPGAPPGAWFYKGFVAFCSWGLVLSMFCCFLSRGYMVLLRLRCFPCNSL